MAQTRPDSDSGHWPKLLRRVHVCDVRLPCAGSYLNKCIHPRFGAVKALGDFAAAAAAVAIVDVPWHMYNRQQTPFDMQNKIVHNDFNKYFPRTHTVASK